MADHRMLVSKPIDGTFWVDERRDRPPDYVAVFETEAEAIAAMRLLAMPAQGNA
jgi:hypothetical protein